MNYTDEFEQGRIIYPGVKRGLKTEFANFCKKHMDWKKVIYKIKPAIENQIKWRKIQKQKNAFVPEWKHFKTWINNRCWEEEYPVPEPLKDNWREKERKRIRSEHQEYLENKSTKALLDIKKDGGHLWKLCWWLIEEILQKRKELGIK